MSSAGLHYRSLLFVVSCSCSVFASTQLHVDQVNTATQQARYAAKVAAPEAQRARIQTGRSAALSTKRWSAPAGHRWVKAPVARLAASAGGDGQPQALQSSEQDLNRYVFRSARSLKPGSVRVMRAGAGGNP